MTRAIHFKCEYGPDRRPRNLEVVGGATGTYRSGFWDISKNEALSLEWGWIYLHETKSKKSYLGGRISKVEQVVLPEMAHPNRIAFIFDIKSECRDQKWRGKTHSMAYNGGAVNAKLPFEIELT